MILIRAVLACLLMGTSALAQGTPDPSPQNSVKLLGVIVALPQGSPWLSLKRDSLCIQNTLTETWTAGRAPQRLSEYSPAFEAELARAGYKVVTPADDLFNQESASADLEVAAVITDEHIDGCISPGTLFTDRGDVRGDSAMKVDWQIYSPIKKQVVARISTSGSARLERSVPGGVMRLVNESFTVNVRELAANADFRAAASGAKPLAGDILRPGKQDKIALAGSIKAGKRPISDAVGSVVTVFSSLGSGSGDLISSDGYMLTNAHVVGDDKQVRVRWSDGIEMTGEVVRVVKTRDVALIKTSARDRDPLSLKRGPVSPGQRVFAIGSPRGQAYEGTVSSGIVSATRTMEGLRYIQSDVAISHGSSGGALLDENGAVIGIAVSGVDTGYATGINFFIPIGDAMDFLNLEQN